MNLSRLFRLALGVMLLFAALTAPLLAAPPTPTPTPEQREMIEGVIRDFIRKNPDFVIEIYQAEQTRRNISAHKAELLDSPTDQVGGNPSGDVTVVEFFDYRCPYCKQMEPGIAKLLKDDPKIRFVHKELPVLGPDSIFASKVALAAAKQGKYEAFRAAMMTTRGSINQDVILKVADRAGLDVTRIKADMADPEIDAIIQKNLRLAEALDINGTPAFVVGNSLTPGAVEIDTLKRLVAQARAGG